jgi:hypothetical protein
VSAPLLAFAKSIAEARRQFVPGDCSSWLAFYEAKLFAYGELLRAQPEVRAIDDEDFWRYVQNTPAAQCLPILARQVKRIRASWVCRDCHTPMERAAVCPKCLKARRLESLRICREQRRETARRARMCPHCGAKLGMRQRFCRPCATSRRRQSKSRSKRRQLTGKSPSEKMKQSPIPVQGGRAPLCISIKCPSNPITDAVERRNDNAESIESQNATWKSGQVYLRKHHRKPQEVA